MNATDAHQGVTIELFVRSLSSYDTQPQQDAVINQLHGLKQTGEIDDYTVSVWGKEINPGAPAAKTDVGRFILDRIERFTNWADRNDVSISPFFDTREIVSTMTSESYTAIELPMMALAEYEGEYLRHVAPCADRGGVYTVSDRLESLETGINWERAEERSQDQKGRPILVTR